VWERAYKERVDETLRPRKGQAEEEGINEGSHQPGRKSHEISQEKNADPLKEIRIQKYLEP